MNKIRGIDVSHWQSEIDWDEVAEDGVAWMIAKATDGISFVDQRFAENFAGATENGIIPGAYHYFQEERSGYDQANHYLDTLQSMLGNPLPPMLFALDYEDDSGQSNSTSADRVAAFLAQFKRRTGKLPILYTSASKWESLIRVSGQVPNWTHELELWIAYYGSNDPDGDLEEREERLYQFGIPQGWLEWRFWQYTSKGSVEGIGGNVDLNFFRGTMADLKFRAGMIPTFGERLAALEQSIWFRMWPWVNRLRDFHGV